MGSEMVVVSVQFSRSVVSDPLRPHESQHSRPPCPSPTPGVHSDSRPSSQWSHPAISSSVVPFSSCPQSLPASEFSPMSQLFAWDGQSLVTKLCLTLVILWLSGKSHGQRAWWATIQGQQGGSILKIPVHPLASQFQSISLTPIVKG